MAEKKIGLRIELNGFRGVITNMKQLEDEIRKAKEDLQELEIGGAMFNTLTKEISRAETELGKLRRTTEGLSVEKQVEGYGKLAAGITGGFAAAMSAMSLFGNESEEMSKAAVQAQNLITLALSARSLAELKTGASIVATTIATRAEAIATSLATKETWLMNTAMKGLFTTIAANPIGAMVAVLGLAITAMMAFGDETEKSVVDLKEINSGVESAAVSLRNYQTMANEAATGTDEHAFAIKQIKKEIPGFNALLDANGRITNEGNLYINNRIKLLGLQAKAQALANAQAKIETEIAINKTKPLEEQLTFFDKLEGYVGYLYFGEFGQQVSNATNAVENMNEENSKLQRELKAVQGLTDEVNTEMAKLESEMEATNVKIKKQAELDAKAAQTKNENNKATKEQIKNNNYLDKALDALTKRYSDQLSLIEQLSNLSKQSVGEPQILKNVRDIVEARKQLQEDNFDKIIAQLGLGIMGLQDRSKRMFDSLKFDEAYQDKFGNFYEKFEKDVTDLFITGAFSEIPNVVDEATKSIDNFVAMGNITPDAVKPIYELMNQYKSVAKLAGEIPSLTDVFTPEGSKERLDAFNKSLEYVLEIEGQYGKISNETRMEIIQGDTDYATHLQNIKKFQQEYYEGLLVFYAKDNEEKEKNFREQLKRTDLEAGDREKLEQKLKDTQAERIKGFDELARRQSEALTKSITTIAEGEATIFKTLNDLKVLTKANALDNEKTQELYVKAVLKNIDLFVTSVRKKTNVNFTEIKKDSERLAKLEEVLAKQGVDVRLLTQQQKLDILKAFLAQEEALIDDSEAKKQERIKKTLDDIGKVISEISNRINQSASIVAQSFQNQLDILTGEYNKDMTSIVGETKEANDKRIELEKIYQEEKRKIEKQARITALKFTLAQTIAQGAQAVVNALASAPPPANFILAGIDAALAAAQIAVIQQQINTAQTYMRRGGMLAGGGIASGPSHEQGGIYAGGGSYIEGNEAIINRQSTLAYSGLLSQINMSQGGRPLVVQSPMDSRLVEALAKQKQEPIRAYVVEQDMTKAQSINKRLEQLASF